MQAFTVVIALLLTAGLGWGLSALARRLLRRLDVPTDERTPTGRQDASQDASR